jgi:putative spermidine/putrescine transport system permease protein
VALLVATVLPLWVSYLVRVYSWRLLLNPDGAINWVLEGVGLPGQNILYTNWAMWVVYSYIWFPFMVLPVYAALERVPASYLEASSDLGARGWTTLRRVVLPLVAPGIAAGSILRSATTSHRAWSVDRARS